MSTQQLVVNQNLRFKGYGDNPSFTAFELRETDCVQAEVADSGSEGVYVEVAIWSLTNKRWERVAFHKFLDGDYGWECAHEQATEYARFINKTYSPQGFVHSMPTYGDKE